MDKGKEIFRLKVYVNDDFDMIRVFENDEPNILAQEFSIKHGLKPEFSNLIELEIEKLIDKIVNSDDLCRTLNSDAVSVIEDDFARKRTNENIEDINENIKIIDENLDLKDDDLSERLEDSQVFTIESLSKLKSMGSLRLSDLKSTEKFNLQEFCNEFRSRSPTKIGKKTKNEEKYQFHRIFKYLNPNSQGKLTIENILMINLKERLCKILMPLIIDIDVHNFSVSYSDFRDKMEILLKYLSDEDKSFLISSSYKLSLLGFENSQRSKSPPKNIYRYNSTCKHH